MTDIYDSKLNEFFGYSNLKPLQKNIIKSILEDKKDVLGVLATGYGKSICYQLPFLVLEQSKSIIVVSAIDNLTKGAAGQAIQNMNIMFGLAETEGLL